MSEFRIPDGSPTLHAIKTEYILYVLRKHDGNKPAAAAELGICLKTLYNKLNDIEARATR